MRSEKRYCHCCCPAIGTWVKAIAVIEMVVCILLMIPLTALMANLMRGGFIGFFTEMFLGVRRELQFSLLCLCWITAFVILTLAVFLFRGVNSKSKVSCQIWLTVNVGVLVVGYMWGIMSLDIFLSLNDNAKALVLGITPIIALFKCVEMFVVFKFVRELKREGVEIFTITTTTPSAPPPPPVRLSSVDQIRSEIFVSVDTGAREVRPTRSCSTTTFESPTGPRSVDLQAVDGSRRYPDLSDEVRSTPMCMISNKFE